MRYINLHFTYLLTYCESKMNDYTLAGDFAKGCSGFRAVFRLSIV